MVWNDINDFYHGINEYSRNCDKMAQATSLNKLCNHAIIKTYIIKACIIVGIISANFGRNVINSFKTLNAFI